MLHGVQHLQEGMKSIFFSFLSFCWKIWKTEVPYRENVNPLDGSKNTWNALLGKGYLVCLDGDERVTRAHGAAFRFEQDSSSMQNETLKRRKPLTNKSDQNKTKRTYIFVLFSSIYMWSRYTLPQPSRTILGYKVVSLYKGNMLYIVSNKDGKVRYWYRGMRRSED